jgi:GAG-pre-integrase domain
VATTDRLVCQPAKIHRFSQLADCTCQLLAAFGRWQTSLSALAAHPYRALGDNSSILATGIGCIPIQMWTDAGWNDMILQDALYVPDLHGNLLSVPQLTRCGLDVLFSGNTCRLLTQGAETACLGKLQENLYIMDVQSANADSAYIAHVDTFPHENSDISPYDENVLTAHTSSAADLHTWHCCLGHVSTDTVICIAKKGIVSGMEIQGSVSSPQPCKSCLKGKQMSDEIQKFTDTHTDKILGWVFSDICGKLPTCSCQGYEYFATFIDDKSCKVWVVGLYKKSDVLGHLKTFVSHVENETRHKVKVLCSDGGGEYTGNAPSAYLASKGIKHKVTTADMPQHNRVAEQMNCTLMDKVRSMLDDSGLPDSYWFDAILYASFLHNVTPTCALNNITLDESWSRNKPDISCLCIFGSRAHMHILDDYRKKLGAKSLTCIFIGYAENCKAFLLVHCQSH